MEGGRGKADFVFGSGTSLSIQHDLCGCLHYLRLASGSQATRFETGTDNHVCRASIQGEGLNRLHVQELVATSQQFRLVLLIELGQVRKQKIQVEKRS